MQPAAGLTPVQVEILFAERTMVLPHLIGAPRLRRTRHDGGSRLEPVALVAPLRRPVKDRLIAHRELDRARRGRMSLVDGAVLAHEDTHHRRFPEQWARTAQQAGCAVGDERSTRMSVARAAMAS